ERLPLLPNTESIEDIFQNMFGRDLADDFSQMRDGSMNIGGQQFRRTFPMESLPRRLETTESVFQGCFMTQLIEKKMIALFQFRNPKKGGNLFFQQIHSLSSFRGNPDPARLGAIPIPHTIPQLL